MKNYIGSVTADADGAIVAASAPKGGLITYWDVAARRYFGVSDLNDGCGLAPTHRSASFLLTSGDGWLVTAECRRQHDAPIVRLWLGQSRDLGAIRRRQHGA